jgi:hypothetical protein
MGIGPFDKAGLVPIAYARVNAAGVSADSNSGITTEKVLTGVYKITLPAGTTLREVDSYLQVQPWNYAVFAHVQQPGPDYYLVLFHDHSGNSIDSDFTIMISTTSTPIASTP